MADILSNFLFICVSLHVPVLLDLLLEIVRQRKMICIAAKAFTITIMAVVAGGFSYIQKCRAQILGNKLIKMESIVSKELAAVCWELFVKPVVNSFGVIIAAKTSSPSIPADPSSLSATARISNQLLITNILTTILNQVSTSQAQFGMISFIRLEHSTIGLLKRGIMKFEVIAGRQIAISSVDK
jgi:hypothetical protein